MKSNAPGQLLGYTMQFPRALYHLLRSSPKDAVYVEVFGDVATLTSDGQLLSEEDKSSISGNPLTDRSTDLWKTFSNWITAILNHEFDVEHTEFVLYCNQAGRPAIVDRFCTAQSKKEAQIAIEYAKDELKDIKEGHEIWEYYNFVISKNEDILIKIIQRFDLQIGNDAGYEDAKDELQRIHVHENQVEFVLDKLNGWLQRVICEKIYNKELALITWEQFHQEFTVLLQRSRCRELIDFTMNYSYNKDDEDVQKQVCSRPIYLQQLEEIDLTEEDILAEIADYLRADVNREKWLADDIIDEDIADDFDKRLKEFWKNQRKKIQITEKTLTEKDKGQLLLYECKSRHENIGDMTPPTSTISGTYHALADNVEIGWHPNWENIFINKKDN